MSKLTQLTDEELADLMNGDKTDAGDLPQNKAKIAEVSGSFRRFPEVPEVPFSPLVPFSRWPHRHRHHRPFPILHRWPKQVSWKEPFL